MYACFVSSYGFSTAIFKTVSAVLMFGNMQFKQERSNDQATLPDNTVAQQVTLTLIIHSEGSSAMAIHLRNVPRGNEHQKLFIDRKNLQY